MRRHTTLPDDFVNVAEVAVNGNLNIAIISKLRHVEKMLSRFQLLEVHPYY